MHKVEAKIGSMFDQAPPHVMYSRISIPYQWQAGDFLARFFEGLKEEILLASVCSKCRQKSLPPKRVCVRCFQATQELVPVNNSGRLLSFTRINLSSAQRSLTGELHEYYDALPNQAWGIVKFEGCDTGMVHFLGPAATEKVSIGQQMGAVFAEPRQRRGTILDICYFESVT